MDVALKWIFKLDENIKNALIEDVAPSSPIDVHKSWLPVLAQAAQEYLYADEFDRRVFTRLIKLGSRKMDFLGRLEKCFFGLGEPQAFLRLPTNVEAKVQVLRSVAQNCHFSRSDVFIRYRPSVGADFELTTA
ncbi:uncharacterized protein N7443_003582 [Penicillium atrosanguineum]|uniref:uncharacterized protein n=1 Tax=Penicillium atrosanguineum TaxID=1132637 RepID=UPI00238CF743|nr:uncharacterized protein N7443_003582 [Penicillium atrosanguineum]KAJ5303922.1 hypothetical protein N7443_003582 [Penicillium atrosanguineum]